MWLKLPTYATNYGVTEAVVLRGVSGTDGVKRIKNECFNLQVIFGASS